MGWSRADQRVGPPVGCGDGGQDRATRPPIACARHDLDRPPGALSRRVTHGRPIRVSDDSIGKAAVGAGRTKWPGVGENLLFVSAGRRGRLPPGVVPVRFVVGYRKAALLCVRLRFGGGRAAGGDGVVASPSTGVASS